MRRELISAPLFSSPEGRFTKRRDFIAAASSAAAWPLAAVAQQPERALMPTAADNKETEGRLAAFLQPAQLTSTSPAFRATSCNNLELAASFKALAHRCAVPIDELDHAVLLLRRVGARLICRRSDALLVLCD
jgi:hypothetical protein